MEQSETQKFINALGSIAETCGALFKALLKQGFSRNEALALTQPLMVRLVSGTKKNPPPNLLE